MCVKKIDAFVDSRNILHHREDTALMTEINILTGLKNSDIIALRKHAGPLIALLDALAAFDEAAESENVTGAETAEKDPPDSTVGDPRQRRAITNWLVDRGFTDLDDFNCRASYDQKSAFADFMDGF